MSGFLYTDGNQLKTQADENFRMTGSNWFGFEVDGLPHGIWGRPYKDMLDEFVTLNMNTLRLPIAGEIVRSTETIREGYPFSGDAGTGNEDLMGKTHIQALDLFLAYATSKKIRVVLEYHSIAFLGSGNSTPPSRWLWRTPNNSPSQGGNINPWKSDWEFLANRYRDNTIFSEIGYGDYSYIVGADLFNEPRQGDTLQEWFADAQTCGNAVLVKNPNWLIIVEGREMNSTIRRQSQEAIQTKYGVTVDVNIITECWSYGGSLFGLNNSTKITLNTPNRLVYSVHFYSQANSDTRRNLILDNFEQLEYVFDVHWGFVFREMNTPLYIGECGDDPKNPYLKQLFSYFMKYLDGDYNGDGTRELDSNKKGISFTQWSYAAGYSSHTQSILDKNSSPIKWSYSVPSDPTNSIYEGYMKGYLENVDSYSDGDSPGEGNTMNNYSITLTNGWNLIGVSTNAQLDLSSANVTGNIWYYASNKYTSISNNMVSSHMGYWMKSNGGGTVTVKPV